MNLIKIFIISLFVIIVFTGIAFAKSDISINDFELPSVSLGITLSSGVNPIFDDGINFDLNRPNIYTKDKEISAIYNVKVIGVILTIVGVTSITIGVSTMFSAYTMSGVLLIEGLITYNAGIIMGLVGAIVDSSYNVNLGVGIATTILSLISGGLGLLVSFGGDEFAGVAMAMPGAFLIIPGIILWIVGSVKYAKREPKNDTYDYSRIELTIREEDGAIGFSW